MPADFENINKREEQRTILQLIDNWLERLPFFEEKCWHSAVSVGNAGSHPFWETYRKLYAEGLTEREKNKLAEFDHFFLNKDIPELSLEDGLNLKSDLSPNATKAALFIMLYRDFPVFQTSYQVLDSLIEIDLLLSNWRHKHIIMVRRMIGLRVGTGNTSGSFYLEGALNNHYIFKDLTRLSTFIIPRNKLPQLPPFLTEQLHFAGSY